MPPWYHRNPRWCSGPHEVLKWTPSLFNSLANSLAPTSQLCCLKSIPIKKQNKQKDTSESLSILDLSVLKREGASQVALLVKNLSANAGNIRDLGSIPGSGGSPGGGHGNPLQCYCLEDPVDKEPGVLWSIIAQRIWHNWSDLVYTKRKNYCNIQEYLKLYDSLPSRVEFLWVLSDKTFKPDRKQLY